METEWFEREHDAQKEAEDTEELEEFRRQWQQELTHDSHSQQSQLKKETEATSLYLMGVAAERSGDTHSALTYYRRAVQLVPDIEYRIYSTDRSRHLWEEVEEDEEEEEGEREERGKGGKLGDVATLTYTLYSMTLDSLVCHPDRLTKQTTHISALPQELLLMILNWVVSIHLDMRSLEQCSMVCKGFYCLARQPGVWRMACQKLWPGYSLTGSYSNSWRQMYILRPHLYFNGVYISKISYVRKGERSLDSYYRPYHTVVYYRYFRFFPDGMVLCHTSPNDPVNVVSMLCHKHSSESVLLGEYSVDGTKLTVDALGYQSRIVSHSRHRGRERKEVTHEQRFHMELMLKRSKMSHLFNQLVWQEHYCHSLHRPTGQVQVSHFSIDYKYPPFVFSRVKSYTTSSVGVLR